ncbi:MAG: FIST C-terminal domain-containing protein [Candidatus Diapherotrites archaeon]|nr:FIST C-terminal domain-containing protein [Candidatus Diapherotrites archaeon]
MVEGIITKWSKLQKLKEKGKTSRITVGIGLSETKNSVTATKEAAQKALKQLNGKKPTISYVYYSGEYDPNEINKGLIEELGGTDYVGGSTDRVLYNDRIIDNGILIVSLQSDFLHVSIASAENISKDPYGIAKKTIKEAVSKLTLDQYIDPYLQVSRMKQGNVEWLLKIPSYFVIVYSRGLKLPVMGDETKIVNAVFNVLGPNVPLFGGSYGAPIEKLFGGQPYEINIFHNGKVLKDGLVVIINAGNILYGQALEHGAVRTDKIGFVSKTSNEGYIVNEISGRNVIDWYAEEIGISREEFEKSSQTITQRWPLGTPDGYGNYIIRGAGVYSKQNGKDSLGYVAPLIEGWPVYIMDAKQENLMKASDAISTKIQEFTSETTKPAVIFANLCASRRAIFKEKLVEEQKKLIKKFGGAPLVGFSCYGEIGSAPGKPAGFQHMSANIFVMYDKLLNELK